MLYAIFILKDGVYLNVYVTKEYEDRDGGNNLAIRIEQKEHEDNFCKWRLPDMTCLTHIKEGIKCQSKYLPLRI